MLLKTLFLMALVPLLTAYKILLYNPKFGPSHVGFTGKIADTLAAAGHDVVVYQPILNENITFTGTKNPKVRYYTRPKNPDFERGFSLETTQDMIWQEEGMAKMKAMMNMMSRVKSGFCREVMYDDENLEKLRAEKFDLALSEMFESCGFGVIRYLGIKKYIATFGGSLFPGMAQSLGIKIHASYTPGMMVEATDQMSFVQRLKNLFSLGFEHYFFGRMFLGGIDEIVQERVPGFRLVDTLADASFHFVNTQEHIDYAQPITHKVIYMGGMGKVQSQPLTEKYQKIFDSAKRGVILFSFGSVVHASSMKPGMKKAFLDAFAEFPDINFLWKYEKDEHEVAKGYSNVFTGKWLPQNDILDHPRLLAFISHGGMNSAIEGSTKGVPMICVPVFADQVRNSRMLKRRGTAVTLSKTEITKEVVVAAIKEIIDNPEYRRNAQQLSRMVKATPLTAEERIVKYAEFAAEFGDTGTLQTQGRHQSFIVLYSIDTIGTVVLALALSLTIIFLVVRKLYRCVVGRLISKKKTE